MSGRARRAAAALALVGAGTTGAAGLVGCGNDDAGDSGAVTNLEEVGPDVAELQAQVTALIQQVRDLEARVAELEANNPPPPG